MDSTISSRTTKPLQHLDIECRVQMLLHPPSSTPRDVSSKRNSHLDPTMSASPRTSLSLQRLEDSYLKQIGGSKGFSEAAAHAQSEAPVAWNLPSRFGLQGRGLVGLAKQGPLDSCSLMGRIRNMSSFQADYWACAIPDGLPPSPDRQSPQWDPNKEYEDLLDYTYPLRPKHKRDKNDSTVHDSGVDLDSLSNSPESSLKILTMQDQEQEMKEFQRGQSSPAPLLTRLDSPAPVSHYRLLPVGEVSFMDGDNPSAGQMGSSGMMAPWGHSPRAPGMMSLVGSDWNSRGHDCLGERDAAGGGGTFLCSTQVLPLPVDVSGDEEYLSLPSRLKELKMLAQQLTDLSLTMTQPEDQPVEDGSPSLSVKREHLPKVHGDSGSDKTQWEPNPGSCRTSSFHKPAEEGLLNKKSGKQHERVLRQNTSQESLAVRCLEFPKRGVHLSKVKDCDRDSLTQCLKIFCGQLEELIPWLHKIADATDNWIPPRVDMESIKTSLQNYLEFKKDLAGYHALIQDVLQDGEMLLKYMPSDSPVLQNTLGLIVRQSGELENHAEHFYESIVAAVDALGAGLMKDHDAQQIAAFAEFSK